MSDDAFDAADYYSTSEDSDTLEHETPAAAIEHEIDFCGHRDCGDSSGWFLNEIVNVTVHAWKRNAIGDADWTRIGESAAEAMQEAFDDEHGSWDETVLRRMGVHEPTLAKDLAEVFQRHITNDGTQDPVFRCERVAKRVYTRAEVETMMRDENPEWFTEEVSL